MMTGIMSVGEKTLAQFAERAKRMDGCVAVIERDGRTIAWEFAQNSMVICLIRLDPPIGHMGKDARRADEIRAELNARATLSKAGVS